MQSVPPAMGARERVLKQADIEAHNLALAGDVIVLEGRDRGLRYATFRDNPSSFRTRVSRRRKRFPSAAIRARTMLRAHNVAHGSARG
jgi:hypothetical protein